MHKIEFEDTGIVFRNPDFHIKSINAYHPSIIQADNGELVATMCVGEAFESVNLEACLSRSTDEGKTWVFEGSILQDVPGRTTSNSCRIAVTGKGVITANFVICDRSRTDKGFTNNKNLGFVETELALVQSYDNGHTWSELNIIKPPLIGPSFELCSQIVVLKDGRWILPTSTWRGWDGFCPNGMKAVAIVSFNKGKTWTGYIDVMSSKEGILFWESKILQLQDGKLLAIAWAYDEMNKRDFPVHYAISDYSGEIFDSPKSTGLIGQTCCSMLLENDRILTVYRRLDKSGLWANVSSIESGKWVNEFELPLWGNGIKNLTSHTGDMVADFTMLRFGAPCMIMLKNGLIFVVFWAVEDCVSNIRWFKLRVRL